MAGTVTAGTLTASSVAAAGSGQRPSHRLSRSSHPDDRNDRNDRAWRSLALEQRGCTRSQGGRDYPSQQQHHRQRSSSPPQAATYYRDAAGNWHRAVPPVVPPRPVQGRRGRSRSPGRQFGRGSSPVGIRGQRGLAKGGRRSRSRSPTHRRRSSSPAGSRGHRGQSRRSISPVAVGGSSRLHRSASPAAMRTGAADKVLKRRSAGHASGSIARSRSHRNRRSSRSRSRSRNKSRSKREDRNRSPSRKPERRQMDSKTARNSCSRSRSASSLLWTAYATAWAPSTAVLATASPLQSPKRTGTANATAAAVALASAVALIAVCQQDAGAAVQRAQLPATRHVCVLSMRMTTRAQAVQTASAASPRRTLLMTQSSSRRNPGYRSWLCYCIQSVNCKSSRASCRCLT
jgi:hypothetical protein